MPGYVPDTHKPGVEHESHAAKVAAMFGGSDLHHDQKEAAPVKRNFTLPRKVSLVQLTAAAESSGRPAPPPVPTHDPNAGQVVVESLSGVGGWAAKFGAQAKSAPVVRRRGSIENLGNAVSGGQGVERDMPKSPSVDAPPSKIFDPSTGNVRTATRPLQVVSGSAEAKRAPGGANRTISFTSDGMLHHSDDEDAPAPARTHPRMQTAPAVHKAPVGVTARPAAAASPAAAKPAAKKYGGGVIGMTNISSTPKPTNMSKASAKSASKWGAPQGPQCPVCERSVFKMEEVLIEGVHFHKWCCRCSVDTCNKRLTAGKYASYKGSFYCKPCFMKAFKEKGNYDEGFGHAQRKLDWTSPEKSMNVAAESDM